MNPNHPPACRDQPGNGFITVQPYTADAYRRRIERAFRACEFSRDNPFRDLIAERIESGRAEFVAEVAEAKAEPSTPF
jgi:hypothetical protein